MKKIQDISLPQNAPKQGLQSFSLTHGTLFSERPKRSNHFKVISPDYKEWSIFDVVAHFTSDVKDYLHDTNCGACRRGGDNT